MRLHVILGCIGVETVPSLHIIPWNCHDRPFSVFSHQVSKGVLNSQRCQNLSKFDTNGVFGGSLREASPLAYALSSTKASYPLSLMAGQLSKAINNHRRAPVYDVGGLHPPLIFV